jgi:hypothetical protein
MTDIIILDGLENTLYFLTKRRVAKTYRHFLTIISEASTFLI